MPQGTGTYGSKRGRPPQKKAGGGKLGSLISPMYGIATGQIPSALSPAALLAKKMKKNKQTPVATTANMKYGGSICKGMGAAVRGGSFNKNG